MGVIKEFKCESHGVFESSHPICPNFGCRSLKVERCFMTPPKIGTQFVKRHEAGMKKLADAYGQTDWNTTKPGDTSKVLAKGPQMLWGTDVKKELGMDMNALATQASQPFTVDRKDGTRETVPHGMRLAATDLGLTQRVLPPVGEMTVSAGESKMKKAIGA